MLPKKILILIFSLSVTSHAAGQDISYDDFRDQLGFVGSTAKNLVKRKGVRFLYKALKAVPYVGKFFSSEEEMVEKITAQLNVMRSVANQAKKVKNGIEELNRSQRALRNQAKKVFKSFKKGNIAKMLLLATEKTTGIDMNPAHYIPKNIGANQFIREWNIETTNERDLLQKLDRLANMDGNLLKLFLARYRGALALKEVKRLRDMLKVKEAKRESLKELLESHKNTEEENHHRENFEKNEKDIAELKKNVTTMTSVIEASVQQQKSVETNNEAIKLMKKYESKAKSYFSGKNVFDDDE